MRNQLRRRMLILAGCSVLSLIAMFVWLVQDDSLSSEATNVTVAVVGGDGAAIIYEVGQTDLPDEQMRWGSAEHDVVDVAFAAGLVLQLLDNGSVRALQLDSGDGTDRVLWGGASAVPDSGAVAISFLDSKPAFLLADGSIRVSSLTSDVAARVVLWSSDVTDFAGHDALIGAVLGDQRVVIMDPTEPEKMRGLALEPGSAIADITRAGDRMLVLFEDDRLLEFDVPSGVVVILADELSSGPSVVRPTGGGGWFGSQDSGTGILELSNGVTQQQVPVDAEVVWVHGNSTSGAAVLDTGQVVGFGFPDRANGFVISDPGTTTARFAGIVSSEP